MVEEKNTVEAEIRSIEKDDEKGSIENRVVGTSLNSWIEEDKPRERIKKYGVKALETHELLAVMLGTGTKGQNVVELSRSILDSVDGDLNALSLFSYQALMQKFKGVGEKKAMQIAATLEFGFRKETNKRKDILIAHSNDVIDYIYPKLAGLNQEEFWVIYLNRRNKIILAEPLSKGGLTSVIVDVKIIMRRSLELLASSIILAHNHPSATPHPSKQDMDITKQIKEAAKLFDISLIDHIIVVDDKSMCYSFARDGDLGNI